MANIQKLTYPYFADGSTQLNAANLNPIIAKMNEVIDKVNGGVTPTQTVATPTISISGTTATITCSTSGATIYYTTNGNTPTTSSTQYSSPITLSGACTIKAIAVKSGMTNSSVASQPYTPAVVGYEWQQSAYSAEGVRSSNVNFISTDPIDITSGATRVRFAVSDDGEDGVSLGLMLFAGSTPLTRILVIDGSTEVIAELSSYQTATKCALMFSKAKSGGAPTSVSEIETLKNTYGMSVEGLEGNL